MNFRDASIESTLSATKDSGSSQALYSESEKLQRQEVTTKSGLTPNSNSRNQKTAFLPQLEMEGNDISGEVRNESPVKTNSAKTQEKKPDTTQDKQNQDNQNQDNQIQDNRIQDNQKQESQSSNDELRRVALSDNRVAYYDKDGTLVAMEKDGKRWELKYDGDLLVRYEGKNSYLEYRANGWNRCTNANQCQQIEGFKVRREDGTDFIITGRVTRADLADPGSAKFADIPEIAASTQRMLDLIRNDGAEGAVKYFSDQFSAMDSEQLIQLERAHFASTGRSLVGEINDLKNEGKLSACSAEVLTAFLSKGKDKRTAQESADLAVKSLGEPNERIAVSLFSGALGGTSEQAVQARALFEQMGGADKIAKSNLGTTSNQSVQDIVKWGSINPATMIRDAFGYTTYISGLNENTITEQVSKMTPQERRDYLEGERLSKTYGPYTKEQEKLIDYYTTLHSALSDASARTENIVSRQRQGDLQSQRKLMGWVDMIRNEGKKDLVAQITDCKGEPETVVKVLRGMTQEQWEKIKNDRQYRQLVERAIDSNFNAPDQSWGYNMRGQNELQRMLAKSNFEDATRVSADRFFDEMGLNFKSPRYVAELCARGDSSFSKSIKTDAKFRERVLGSINRRTDVGSAEREFAIDSIQAIVEDRVNSKPTELKRLILKGLMSEVPPLEMARKVRSALIESPELKDQLAGNPQFANNVNEYLTRALKGDRNAATKLLSGQGLNVSEIKSLTTTNHTYVGVDSYGRDKVMTEPILNKEDAIDGLSLLDESDRKSGNVLAGLDKLSPEERKVADAVANQGKVQPEDAARLFVLKMNNSGQERVEQIFNDLNDAAKQNAITAYKNKYGGNLVADTMAKVSDAGERVQMQQALSLRPRTSLGALSRGLEDKANAENVSQFGRALTELIAGNSYRQADKVAGDSSIAVKELADRRQQLSPVERLRLDEALRNIARASQDIRDGKKQAVETLEKSVIAAGAILAIPMTMGQSGVALLVGSATLIGLSEAVLRQQIKGADYNNNDMIKDAVIIGSGVLLDAAPLVSRLITQTLTREAKGMLRQGVKSEELRRELQETITLAARDKGAGEKALVSMAKKYAQAGKEEALYARLQSDFSMSANQLKKAHSDRTANLSRSHQPQQTQQSTAYLKEQTSKPDPKNFYKPLAESKISATKKIFDNDFRPTDARQLTVWGKGNAVKISGETGDFVVEGFERTTGNVIVRPLGAQDTPLAQRLSIKATELEQHGFKKVAPDMNMYIKDGLVYKGTQIKDRIDISTTNLRIVQRDRVVPPSAATSVVERTASKSELYNTLPLSGEDQYKLLTFLKRADRDGLASLNLAESNEMSALLKRVQPGDTIVSSAMKNISLEEREAILSGCYIQYGKNMPKPGDMRDIASVAANQKRDFVNMREGAEKLPEWDWHQGTEVVTKEARVYTLTNGSEIVMPESLAKRLDEVRRLREIAEVPVSGSEALVKKFTAKLSLALHPYRNHPLPEELARMILETPNPTRIKSYRVPGLPFPGDMYDQAKAKFIGLSFPKTSASATISQDRVTLYPLGAKNRMNEGSYQNIFLDNNHEWSHNAEKGLYFDAYEVAREVEALPVPKVARSYALTDGHEDWAVMFGENLMTGDPRKLIDMAEQTPLRAITLTNSLRQEIAAAKSSPHAAQLLERIKLVEQTAMPKAQKVLQQMTRSGDPQLMNRAVDYVRAVQIADPPTAALIGDYEGMLKIMSTTQDAKLAAKLAPVLKPYLKNRPEMLDEIIDKTVILNFGTADAIQTLVLSDRLEHRLYATRIFLNNEHVGKERLIDAFRYLTKKLPMNGKEKVLDLILDHHSDEKLQLLKAFSVQPDDPHLLHLARRKLAQMAGPQR